MNYCIKCGNKIKSARCNNCGYNYKKGGFEQSDKEVRLSIIYFFLIIIMAVLSVIVMRLDNDIKLLTPIVLIANATIVVRAKQNFPRSSLIRVVYYLFLTNLLIYIIYLAFIFLLYITCKGF